MFEFADVKTAKAVVNYELTRNKVVYSDYITANEVTLDNVSSHVAALQGLAFPDFDSKTADDDAKYARKAFGNRVRNGLNTHLGKVVPSKAEPAAPSTGYDDTQEDAETLSTGTPVRVPADDLRAALVAAQAAGMTRDEILDVVSDAVAVAA